MNRVEAAILGALAWSAFLLVFVNIEPVLALFVLLALIYHHVI